MSDTMFINSTLHPGDELRSANGTFALRFQLDGNLVLYVDSQSSWATQGAGAPGDAAGTHMNRAIWTANTYGPKPTNHRCLMQGDGNLVIYGGPQQKALWASQSQNKGGSRLVVQDDGNVVIYTKDFRPIYDTKTSVALSSGVNTSAPDSPTAPPPHKTDVLPYSPTSGAVAIFELKFGDELRSANGTFALKFQPDGNLVLYVESKSEYARLMNRAIWNADSANRGGTRCLMGRDGNLDIIDARGGVVKPIFTAPGLGHLVMQDDGNVVLYNVGNEFRWQTRTSVDETPGANV